MTAKLWPRSRSTGRSHLPGRIHASALAVVRAAVSGQILNIHPSLLPSFPGLEAQQQAFAYGVKVSGCTVHFVDEELDHGAIIVQKTVPVLDTDDEHTLAARILEQEHIAYTEAIRIVVEGNYRSSGATARESQKSEVRLQK